MKAKVVIMHGLPGSGKSTFAREFAASASRPTVVLSRDAIRFELFGVEYKKNKGVEQVITELFDEELERLIAKRMQVVLDGCNLEVHLLRNLMEKLVELGVDDIEQRHFDVPVEVCKQRVRARAEQGGHDVPDAVIDRMAKRAYLDGHLVRFALGANGRVDRLPTQMSENVKRVQAFNVQLRERFPMRSGQVVLLDLDGTLVNNAHLADAAFGAPGERNFEMFYRDSEFAPVNDAVLTMLWAIRHRTDLDVIALTGRDDIAAEPTIRFLEAHNVPVSSLYMKPKGDRRRGAWFKQDMLNTFANKGWTIVHAIDDDELCIEVFEDAKVPVSIVERPAMNLVFDGDNVLPYQEPVVQWGSPLDALNEEG